MVNFLAIIVASVVSVLIAMFWYSSAVFGPHWMRLAGISKKDADAAKKKMAGSMIMGLVSTFISFWALALIMESFLVAGIGTAILVGLLVWVGFVLTTTLSPVLWEGKSFTLYVLNNSYTLISVVIGAIIIGAWL